MAFGLLFMGEQLLKIDEHHLSRQPLSFAARKIASKC
jgi:hypothetical protein